MNRESSIDECELASLETSKYCIQVFRLERACFIREKLCSLSEVEMNTIFQIEKVNPLVLPETPIVSAPVIERSRNERSRNERIQIIPGRNYYLSAKKMTTTLRMIINE